MLLINPPQHETSCCAELKSRYAGLVISDGIPVVGKLGAQAGNTCGDQMQGYVRNINAYMRSTYFFLVQVKPLKNI